MIQIIFKKHGFPDCHPWFQPNMIQLWKYSAIIKLFSKLKIIANRPKTSDGLLSLIQFFKYKIKIFLKQKNVWIYLHHNKNLHTQELTY